MGFESEPVKVRKPYAEDEINHRNSDNLIARQMQTCDWGYVMRAEEQGLFRGY